MAKYSESTSWQDRSIRERCRTIGSVAGQISRRAETLVRLCESPQRDDPVQTIASELMPLCSALRFIGRRGPAILKPRRFGVWGRPTWLVGVHSTVARAPLGQVLILAAWNYPLLLAGVQAAQGLAGGNRVLLKPAPGCEASTAEMVAAFHDAGVPVDALVLLDSDTQAAVDAIDAGVDLIVLTGAAATGRKVMAQAAESLTPTIMELSGCDGVIVLPSADIDRVADCVNFGLTFNAGATCIAPRRLIADSPTADRLRAALVDRAKTHAACIVHPAARGGAAELIESSVAAGAVDLIGRFDGEKLRQTGSMFPLLLDQVAESMPIATADVFVPVTSLVRVAETDSMVRLVNDCPYRLAASVFGSARDAADVAGRLEVGSVAINDLIVPTADPRVPFGGRGQSGFGVTRGAEGLLAMTTPKVVAARRGRLMPHLMPRKASDRDQLLGVLGMLYGSTWSDRFASMRRMGKKGG